MTTERHLCVVAHPDDDLLFVNPDTALAIRRGAPTRVVVVSAGEFNGNGGRREDYAESRRLGACAAYARIAGVRDRWDRRWLVVGGRRVERDVLVDRPAVDLVLLALPDGGDDLQPDALMRMWTDPGAVAHTLVYPGSPVRRGYEYRAEDLRAVLAALVGRTAPTVVCTLDGDPDPHLRGDHDDHVAVVRFTRQALRGRPHAQLVEHRCYNTADCAVNLPPAVVRDKTAAFDAYARFDQVAVGQPGWSDRTYRRWDPGGTWAGTDGDGRSHAFCVRGGSVLVWRQGVPGGSWRAPVDIGGVALAATLAVGANADGRLEVFGVSTDTHDIVTSCQEGRDGPYSPWVSLGSPGGRHTGPPCVGANADGRLEVFVKNSGGGISTTYQTEPNGGFSPWVDFGGGPDVQGVPAVLTRPDGRMALFATTRTGLLWWSQDAPNAGWSGPVALVDGPMTGPPAAALTEDGRAEVFYRVDEGAVNTVHVTRSGSWSAPTGLGGTGTGPVAALPARGRVLLLGRDADGRATACRPRSPDAGFTGWTDTGLLTTGTPALTTGPDGRPVAVVQCPDGRLRASTVLDGPEVAFSAWRMLPAVPGV